MAWSPFRVSPRCPPSLQNLILLLSVTGMGVLFLYNSLPRAGVTGDKNPETVSRHVRHLTSDPQVTFDPTATEIVVEEDSELYCSNLEGLDQEDSKLVQCLKKSFLIPPNSKPYNLRSPEIRNPSQYGQNIFVQQLLGNKRDGFFIECGAYDGEELSNTLMLERDFGWTGLLIEPQTIAYKRLEFKNRKAYISNACLSIKPFAEKLHIIGRNVADASARVIKFKNDPMKTKQKTTTLVGAKVQCFPLFTYLLALNRTVIDYFSLDVEASDFDILKTIPFDRVIFKVLEVEITWIKEGRHVVKEFMESKGYKLVKHLDPDFIFVHNSLKVPNILLENKFSWLKDFLN